MPLTEARKEYQKEYRKANKEKQKEYREKAKEYQKDYRENNKEKAKEYNKEYRKTEVGIKSQRISKWKQRDVISDDYDKLYEMYMNTNNCEECNIELIEGRYGNNRKCLDHCHKTGEFRNVLCNGCNNKRR